MGELNLNQFESVEIGKKFILSKEFHSLMERDMYHKYNIRTVKFHSWTQHGFAKVEDEFGHIWHVHPESLIYKEE
jgi:hypothetical protein